MIINLWNKYRQWTEKRAMERFKKNLGLSAQAFDQLSLRCTMVAAAIGGLGETLYHIQYTLILNAYAEPFKDMFYPA